MDLAEAKRRANAFLGGERLTLAKVREVFEALLNGNELSMARAVLARIRDGDSLNGPKRPTPKERRDWCRKEAELTSKDQELLAAVRHDTALDLLRTEFAIDEEGDNGVDGDTWGVAGGIAKRRWMDLGQLSDLKRAARYYERGAQQGLGEDGYCAINAAFIEDLLAANGDEPQRRQEAARVLRESIVRDLPADGTNWFNVATRAEALFGLERYAEATTLIATAPSRPAWKRETTARQLAALAYLKERNPYKNDAMRAFFDALVPGLAAAARSAMLGKLGLALSGGGFRASFFHLGVLARLAELDVLRHVDVLSCVSGGSIVGTCYYLKVLAALRQGRVLQRDDYVRLIQELVAHFETAVATNLRGTVQPGLARVIARFLLKDEKGAIDSARVADALDEHFYKPLMRDAMSGLMSDLRFDPPDHDSAALGGAFNPARHNWMRVDKVPALVLNATTINTGHGWQFTPLWMGESPWATYETADCVPRLEWAYYDTGAGWTMRVGRAVAASACVPGIFTPLRIDGVYPDLEVQLVDGGVYDNQGAAALLAMSCTVVIVSDAAGQLLLEKRPTPGAKGLLYFAQRTQDTLMERIRGANHSDLGARRRSGLLRGLMTIHMKAGLAADPIRLPFSQQSYSLQRSPLTTEGVRREFQEAIAELRTDLDAFTPDEARSLMACGYQMASKAYERDLAELVDADAEAPGASWVFAPELAEITSPAPSTPRRSGLLEHLKAGKEVKL